MRFARVPILLVIALAGCKIRRLPELPAERDPTSPEAPVTDYEPPPDVLTEELSSGAAEPGDADPHAGHHGHHGGGK